MRAVMAALRRWRASELLRFIASASFAGMGAREVAAMGVAGAIGAVAMIVAFFG